MSLRIFVFLVILSAALPLSAQVEQATILGTVTDSSARVRIVNTGSSGRMYPKSGQLPDAP
jgi:hypothetical protein